MKRIVKITVLMILILIGIISVAKGSNAINKKPIENIKPTASQNDILKNLKIVAVGDSNTQQNFYSNQEKTWTKQLGIINLGKSGTSTTDEVKIFNLVIEQKPDIVLIMFGTNDARMASFNTPFISEEEFRNNLQVMIDQTKSIAAEPILMTAIPTIEKDYYKYVQPESFYSSYGGKNKMVNAYNDVVRKLAQDNNIGLIDNWKLFNEYAGGITNDKIMQADLIFNKGVHMNYHGAKVFAENLRKKLIDDRKNIAPTETVGAIFFAQISYW